MPLKSHLIVLLTLTASSHAAVDRSQYNPSSPIKLVETENHLLISWPAGPGQTARLDLNLAPKEPLFSKIAIEENNTTQTLASNIDPQFTLTIGSRQSNNERYVFFDNPRRRPYKKHLVAFEKSNAASAASIGRRATITIPKLSAGPFSGDLRLHFYENSPLVHIEAALTPDADNLAYFYDLALLGQFQTIAFKNLSQQFQRIEPSEIAADAWTPTQVRNRAIYAESKEGSIALFPPPHAFFFPLDYSNNLHYAQFSKTGIGLRQDPTLGGPFVPWFDAPKGKTQRMSAFLLLSPDSAEKTHDRVLKYTHADRFPSLPGHVTFTSHYHSRLAVNQIKGTPVIEEFVRVWKEMNVDIVHIAEFHGDGRWDDPGPIRLPEMKMMFDLCEAYSDKELLILPGEEGIRYLSHPYPATRDKNPGHWMYLFPKPVYLTWTRRENQPFVETIEPYGPVYHIGSRDDMFELLKRESGLAWSTHPRIKASLHTPDAFKDQDFFKSKHWLGAAWKAMPGDLSQDRLGRRCLDLLDDMNHWVTPGGPPKFLPGEVDVFEIDRTHELYAHMNINYLKLDSIPPYSNWSPVLTALSSGQFFTTTGEILIADVQAKDGHLTATLHPTFPLSFAELITSDGTTIKRQKLDLTNHHEFTPHPLKIPYDPKTTKWLRLEAWDIALNGAFTQPIHLN